MSKNGNLNKRKQLKMPYGTACGRLRKKILFHLIKTHGYDSCYQCGKKIEKEEDLSIEHKKPWLNSENPHKLFFDINNIAFSHLNCNISNTRYYKKAEHGSLARYKNGCRCKKCIENRHEYRVLYYKKTGK